ncbi:hypothetical protein BO86DRAFT_395755 [Aspergillus japonicus CBS 114.51]|uniref:Uncharacterized protein n=1 Tax=Aspergillus japonicus CBS 114.51 TaxID=1448312 RepID=A0A8T8XG26_ASPJA|nr:hypothetical protein BO86DRAFT_395755 [Aspergillus japonicus CBS 114.51]RAH86319.1 hypothetical protein BO86DRAFT_395755 [Aspergillus japonicus CBS 114.51]
MNVPSVSIDGYKEILKSRLDAALAFETSFRDFLLTAGTRSVQSSVALNTLAKSQDAMKTYAVLHDIKKREYDDAVESNEKAEQIFNTAQAELGQLGNKFQQGIEKYKVDQIKEATRKSPGRL